MKNRSVLYILIAAFILAVIPAVFLQCKAEADLTAEIGTVLVNADYKRNEKTGFVIFTVETELTNLSEADIMEIRYRIHFFNKAGDKAGHATATFNGQDTPLKPGETVTHFRSGQFEAESVPAEVSYEVLEVSTAEEMPPIHIPQAGEFLYQAHANTNLNHIPEEPPVSVRLWIDRGGDRNEAVLDDPEDIAEFTEAFTHIRIAEESDTWVTDNYNGVEMTFANGENCWISLNLSDFEYPIYGEWHIFVLEDDGPFWTIMYDRTSPGRDRGSYGGS